MFSRYLFFGRMGRGAKAYAPSNVPVKGTDPISRFGQQLPKGNHPCTIVPVCGAYAIHPSPDGRKNMIIFLTTDMQRFPIFIRQTIGRSLCIRRNGIGSQAPDLGRSCFSSVRVTLKTYGFLFFIRQGNAENVWVQLFSSEWVGAQKHTPSRRHRWWRMHVLHSSPWRGR